MTHPAPDDKAAAAVAGMLNALRGFSSSVGVMAMMSAAWRGDLDRARETLHRLSLEERQRAHLAVLALLAMIRADEEEAGRTGPQENA